MVYRISIIALMASLVAACAVTRQIATPHDDLILSATEGVNPDAEGRSSPIALKILQLTARTTFDNLDFDGLFGNARTLLSDQLVKVTSVVVQPGERREQRVELSSRTRYLAIVAAYRDIDRASWKLVYAVDGDWYYSHQVVLGPLALRNGDAAAAPPGEDADDGVGGQNRSASRRGQVAALPEEPETPAELGQPSPRDP